MKAKSIVWGFIGIYASVLLFGCSVEINHQGKDDETSSAKSEKTKVIGISLPTQREERWVRDKLAMETAAKEAGIKILMTVADANPAQQSQQVENLLSRNIDVLILAPQDAAAAATLVEKANEAGVPVLSYDRLISNTDKLVCYLSFDNERVGELQGEFFVKNVPSGNIVLFGGAPTDNNAVLFHRGAMSKIQPKIDDGTYTVLGGTAFQEVCTENWLPEKALNRASAILTSNAGKSISGVLAPNDGLAGGIIQAFKAAQVSLPVITGQDSEISAVKRVKAGEQSMTVYKDTRDLAKQAVLSAQIVADGGSLETNNKVDNGTVEVPSILLEATVVTKENLNEVLIESGYMKAGDLK